MVRVKGKKKGKGKGEVKSGYKAKDRDKAKGYDKSRGRYSREKGRVKGRSRSKERNSSSSSSSSSSKMVSSNSNRITGSGKMMRRGKKKEQIYRERVGSKDTDVIKVMGSYSYKGVSNNSGRISMKRVEGEGVDAGKMDVKDKVKGDVKKGSVAAEERKASTISSNSSNSNSSRLSTGTGTGMKRKDIESQREKRNKVKTMLVELGKKIYSDLDNGIFPEVYIPSRSVANIVYDKRLRQYVLGDAKIVRSAKNIRHLRSFTQLIWLAFFVDKLVNEGKTSTLRDVYYSAQAFNIDFEDQAESDHIITDLEAVLSLAREDFNIYPEERSSIFGDLTIEYTVPGYEGKRLNLSDHPDGYLIGPSLSSAEFIDTSAEMVLAVEKGGIFTRFVEENVHKRFKAIIVDTAGQAPRSTRYLLMRLNRELNLPVYILTDGDVYGEHIAMVIKSGSANAAHLRELTVPDAKWIGVWASDIQKYRLPTDPMTEQDVKRCHELKQDPRYQSDIWRSELELFLKMRRKSELEAFAKYGLTKITDDYLPEKLEMAKSL